MRIVVATLRRNWWYVLQGRPDMELFLRVRIIAMLTTVMAAAAGCANYSSFQTGRTAGDGALRLGMGLSVAASTQLSTLVPIDDESADATRVVPVPNLELWGRYGIKKDMDIGLRLYLLGVSGEFKVQFAGDQHSPFAASAGLIVNYFGYEVSEDQESDSLKAGARLMMFDATMAVYLSYSVLDEWLNFYLSPKYLSRNVIISGTIEETGGRVGANMDLVGSGLGIAVGRDFSLYLEYGLFVPIGFDGVVHNFGFGFDF